VELSKGALDLGVVVSDGQAALAFYRDVLGLEHVGDIPMPGGGTMHRLAVGDSLLKLVQLPGAVQRADPPGPFNGSTGFRYLTFPVTDITETVAACEAAGRPVVWPVRALRPGLWVAMVADPDGNAVEFVTTTEPTPASSAG
jgi:glyoxylase I family protein